MKPKMCNNRKICVINVPRGIRRATMGRSSREFVDTRLSSLNPTLNQRWGIPLPFLSPMGGWTLKMMSIRSIGWRTRAAYLSLWSIRKYRISWFCTCKVVLVHEIWVSELWSWKKYALKQIECHSVYFSPQYTVYSLSLPDGGGGLLHQFHKQHEGEKP